MYKTKIQSATTIFEDARENIWIGGEDAPLTMIKPNNEIKTYPIKDVQAIAELGPKQLIIATKSRVHSLNPYNGRIKDLDVLKAKEDQLYYAINDLKITHEGVGLFATEGAGLLIYDFQTEELNVLNENSGLPSNNITGIEGDLVEGFWIATNKGLAYYESGIKSLKVYSELNGLTTNELTTGFAKLEDGSFVVGSTKGVNVFKPRTMLAQQELIPELKFERLLLPSVKNKKNAAVQIAENDPVEVKENSGFQISFAGISHLSPDSILYSWKMEGLEDDWSKAVPMNTANYSNLAPGDYTFRVRAKLEDSAWSQPKELPVHITAVTGTISTVYLFMGISVLAMVAIFIFVFIRRSKNADLVAKAELRDQLQKEFKTPVENAVKSLSKISGAAEMENTEDLQRFAARFDDLFNQIVNFNYQESAIEISRINLHTHLSQVVRDIEPVYKMKDLKMIINDQWGEGEFFYNMETLDKVFFSLISGSAGYSFTEGKIIVNLIQTNTGDLKLQITDNGRGIPDPDVKVLEKKKALNSQGKFLDKSGIGYILKAKYLIAKSGGSFSYETEQNEGSTFTVIFKNKKHNYRKVPERAAAILKAEKTKEPITELPPEIRNLSESKILIIDDDLETRKLLVTNIAKYCQIYQTGSAEEGLEKAEMVFPDIIISGTVLPDMNAFQLAKMLKRNIGLNHINRFLVADDDQALGESQLEEFSGVIRKPIQVNRVLSEITKVLCWQRDLKNSYLASHKEHTKVKFRSESDERFISNLNDIIIQNINNDNFSVHDLSHAIGITSNSLFMKLKNLVDLSPQDFIEFTHLKYAKKLLDRGELNAMEVAYKSGFSSPKLFYSSFEKFYGYSFSDSIENKTI